MKTWPWFVLGTILCWGAYVPTLHTGQLGFGQKNGALRAFLFVGLAYFFVSLAVLVYAWITKAEPMSELSMRGVTFSTLAGLLGALGALGIAFALVGGGRPLIVAPVVFAGAPIVNTLVTMIWHKPAHPPGPLFYVGIVLAAIGASMVLRFRPT